MSDTFKQRITSILLLGLALIASLRLYCLINPLYIPTVDDSAIVMRYLLNFQHGHFFTYNIEDGPVYGISCFWLGLTAGLLSWAGLDPQAALMTVALASTILFFYAALRLCHYANDSLYVTALLGASVFYAALFIPRTMFLGLETPLHLWLVSELLLSYLKKQGRLFYVLSAACVISKLDTAFLVAFLLTGRLFVARQAGELKAELQRALLFFLLPYLVWLLGATWAFGNPIPQSFQSKFLLIARTPRTTWFPFLEPLINSPRNLNGVLLVLASMILAIALKLLGKVSGRASSTFAILCLGTMGLYYVYNPGERMAWYYALPEFLGLMCLACLPADTFRSTSIRGIEKTMLVIISVGLLFFTVRNRAPMHLNAAKMAPAWQIVYEQERMESGLLANEVAPKNRPVLWTGHGYPAYLFNGYVVDYAGLNFRGIWEAAKEARAPSEGSRAFLHSLGLSDEVISSDKQIDYKAGLLLMKMFNPNVYMQHGLFTPEVQSARRLRLVGSFYTFDLVGTAALHVFVEDPNWQQITWAIPEADIKVEAPSEEPKRSPQSYTGQRLTVSVPAHASELLFGVLKGAAPMVITIQHAFGGQQMTCLVPPIKNKLHAPEVHACRLPLQGAHDNYKLDIALQPGGQVTIFEPAISSVPTH